MGSFAVVQILAGVCLFSLCAADFILLQPNIDGYQLVRTRRQAAPHVNVHTIPKTSFSCEEKKLGEYYADMETRCQVYHICLPGVGGKLSPMSFVCPNGTIFSQASRVCSPFDRVYCAIQERFYESLHGDANIRRTDYGNVNDYASVKYNEVPPRVTNTNDISEEDDFEETPATRPPPPPPRRSQRPSGRNSRPQTPPPPPPPQSNRRQQSFRPAPPVVEPEVAPPPPPPQQPAIRRQPSFRPVPVVPVNAPEPEITEEPEIPQRNAAPASRRPVNRNQVSRGPPAPTTTEEPEAATNPPQNRNVRIRVNQNRGPNVRVAVPLVPLVPSPPPVDFSIPEGIQYAQPARGSLPESAIRLPPALRAVARPVFPALEADNESPSIPTGIAQGGPQPGFQFGPQSGLQFGAQPVPQAGPRPAPFQPNFGRAVQPSSPVTRAPQPSTSVAPTTSAPTESAPTTAAPQANNDYEYAYDYDFNPSGSSRSKRHVEELY